MGYMKNIFSNIYHPHGIYGFFFAGPKKAGFA